MSTPLSKPTSNPIIAIAEKIISYGLPILYFLISVAFYLRTYDSAQIKITLIEIGGTIIVAAWLIKLIEENGWKFYKNNLVVTLPLLAFLVSGIVSYYRSPFPYASANELIRRVMYICMALIVVKEFNSDDKLKTLINWLLAAAFLSTIYGVIQFVDTRYFPSELGVDPFIWRKAFGARVFSTFGNPNFFGDFLVVMSPITLALFMKSRRFYLILLWILVALCTIWTGSKGAWLGFGAGLVVFTFLVTGFFLDLKKAKLKKIIFIALIGSMLFVGYGIYKNLLGRTDSASFRIFTWLSTVEMIKTNPVLGTGIGTFYVTYPAWRRPQIFFIEGRHNTETDHPENEYLEVWYDEGLVGMGIFLWVLATFLFIGFNNLKVFGSLRVEKSKVDLRAYYQLGILTALSAQLVHNLVCVSLRFVSSGIFLWLLIGLIGALHLHYPFAQTVPNPEENNNGLKNLKRAAQALIALAAVYFIMIFYGYFSADINHNMAIFYSKQGQWPQALEHYNTVTKQNPSFIMAHYFLGNVYNDRWGKDDSGRSIDKYKDVWKLAPNYVQSHHQAGLIYLKWGEDEKRLAEEARSRGDLKSAQEHDSAKVSLWNNALSEFELYRTIDPVFPLNYYRIAWVYMQMGRPDKAEEAYLAHLNFPQKLKEPPHSAWVEDWTVRRKKEYAETCVNLGNLKFMQNKIEEAQNYYERAVGFDPDSVSAMKNLAVIYGRTGRVPDASALWQKLRTIAPQDPDVQRVFAGPPK